MTMPYVSIADRRRRRQVETSISKESPSTPRLKSLTGPIKPLVINIPTNDMHLLMEAVTCSYWSPESATFENSIDNDADIEVVKDTPEMELPETGNVKTMAEYPFNLPKLPKSLLIERAGLTSRRMRASLPKMPPEHYRGSLASPDALSPSTRPGHARSWSVTKIKPEEYSVATKRYREITGDFKPSVEIMPAERQCQHVPLRQQRGTRDECCADVARRDESHTTACSDARQRSDGTHSRESSDGYSQSSTLVSDDGGDGDSSTAPPTPCHEREDRFPAPVHKVRRKPAPAVPPELDEEQHIRSSICDLVMVSRSSSKCTNDPLKKQRRYGTIFAYEPRDASLEHADAKQWPAPPTDVHAYPSGWTEEMASFGSARMPPPLEPPPGHRRQHSAPRSQVKFTTPNDLTHDRDAPRSSYFHHNGLRRSQSTGNFARRMLKRYVT